MYERDSITQQATTIGKLETVGLSWRLMDEELAALEAVTPEDIQQAARSYFTRSRLSVAHVLPRKPEMSDCKALRNGLLACCWRPASAWRAAMKAPPPCRAPANQ